MRSCAYQWLMVGIFWQVLTVRTRLSTMNLKPAKVEVSIFRTGIWVWKYMLLSIRCFKHISPLVDGQKEEACRVAASNRSDHASIFCFCRTAVPAKWNTWLTQTSQCRLPHLSHTFELWPKRLASVCVRCELCCGEEDYKRLRAKRVEKEVGGTRGTNKKDGTSKFVWSDKEKSKNEGSSAKRTNFTGLLAGKLQLLAQSMTRS